MTVNDTLDLSNSILTVGNDSTLNVKDLSLANSTVNLQNGKIDSIDVTGELNATDNTDIKIDVDLSSGSVTADSIVGNNTSTAALNVIVSNNDLSEDLAIGTMSAISNAIVENSLGVSGNSVNFFDANGNAITDTNKNYISSEKYLYTLNQGTSTNSNKLVLSKEAMISGVAADISDKSVLTSIVKGDTQLDIWGAVEDTNGDYIKNNGVINHDITIAGDNSDSGSTPDTEDDIISSYLTGASALTGFTVAENNTLTIKDIEGINGFKDYSVKLENDADLVLDNTILNNSQSAPSHSDVLLTSNNTITIKSDSTVSNITSSEVISGDAIVSNKLILSGTSADTTKLDSDNISGVQVSLDNAQLTVNDTLDLSNSILVVGENSNVDMSASGTTLKLSDSEIKLNKNNQIDNITVNKLNVSNDLNLALDADLANKTIDSIEASNILIDSNSTIKITDVNVLSDLGVGEKEVSLSPLDGLQKTGSSYFDISAIGIGGSGNGKVLSGKYVYKLSVLDDELADEKLLFSKVGITNAEALTGLPKAIYDKSPSYTMTGDEKIDAWLADSSTGETDGGKLLADITVNGQGFDIIGNSNAGLVVNENRTLTLEDVANIGGFETPNWEGGSIHNEGTTKVVANNSDVNFGLSTDSTGNNAIYNTGDLYLTTDSDSSITFTDNASITGSTTDRGTIYTNGNVNLDDVSNNNIVVESGSLSFKDLSLDDSLSLRAEYDDQNTTGVKITGETIAVTSGQKSEIDLQNGNTKDELSVNNVSGDVNLKLDASLSGNGSIDKVTLNNVLGKVYIPEDGVNISSDMDYGKHSILLNAFADMLDADKDNIDASKVPTEMRTIDYVYDVEYKDGSQDKGAFEFTKKGKLTGLPHAIANSEDTYVLKNSDGIEHIDIWGVEPGSNQYNNGVFLNDMTISTIGKQSIKGYQDASGNPIVGMTVGNDASGNGIKVILDKVDSVTGFSTAFKVQESGSLYLTDTSVYGNAGSASLADIELSGNALLTVKDTDSNDGYNTKIGKVLGKDGNTSSLVLSGNISAETISNVDTLLENDSLLTITDAGLLDLANKTIILKGNANVTVDNPMTGTSRLVLKNSVVDMADEAKTINRIETNELTIEDDVALALDADLANKTIDSIEASNILIDSNSTIKITDVNVLSDLGVGEKEVSLSPLDGLQKTGSSYFDISAIGIGGSGNGKVLSGKYVYKLSVLDDELADEKLLFSKVGITNAEALTGLPKAIYDKSPSYTMTGDEKIDAWLADSSTGETDGGKLLADITVNGQGFDIIGNSNAGLVVNENRTLTLEDVANIGGFETPNWEGGSIHNEGTTKVVANNSDVNFGLSTDSTGNNAIYNTGDLYLTTDSDSSITFTDNASITGSTTDRGTIYTNGNVNLDDVSNNNIVVESGSLSFKDLSLDDSLSLRAEYDDQNTTGVKITGETIAVTSGQKSEIDLQNGNTKDELSVNNVSGDVNLKLDASLSGNGSIDKVTLNNVLGKVYIPEDGVNISSDMDYGKHSILLNAFADMLDADKDNIDASKVPTEMRTIDYVYDVEYKDGSQDKGAFEFTKKGKLTGLPHAIANSEDTYVLKNSDGIEHIDIWGVEPGSNQYNNGVFLNDMTISTIGKQSIKGYQDASGNPIVGMTVGNDASGNGIKVILDKVDSVTGFSTAFKVQESGSLYLTDTSVYGNAGSASLADIELSGNALLTVKDTDSNDGYNTKIGKVLGKDGNTSSLVLSGNISAETISNVDTLLENDSLLTITDAGLLDLANKTIILKGNANVTVDNPMTGTSRLVLKNSVVDMADEAKTINRIETNELTLEDEVNLSFNVDLSSNKVDKITYNTLHTDNLTSVNIKDISILNDAINANDTVIFAPIDGLQKGTSTDLSYYYNSNALGYILGTYYFYTLGVKDEINKDSTLSQEYLVLTRTGKTNFDRLQGLEEAIAKGENSFVMTEDEVIEEWLGYEDVNGGFTTEGGKLKDDIVISGNGFDIKGQDNKGLYVGLNKELTLDDVANLGGFVSPDWEGGSIHNEGTTKVFANNSDVNFGLSTDSTGYNAIYNTGDLYLTTDKDSSITFVDNASITGTSTGIGTIYTNGNVNLDNVSNNNIVAQNGSLSIKDLTLDKQTSLITQKGQVPFGDKDGVEISIDNIIATDTTNIDLRNDNSSDSLVVDKLQGDSNLALDASLSGKGTIDKVNISNLDGKLTISSDELNVISDMDLTNQKVLLNPFEGMNSVDISKIEVNVPNLISTENYQYKVSYGSKNDGEFIFTKFGKLTGFADAIAKAKNEYLFTSDEAIDIWGVEKDGKYNNGTTLDNIVVNGQGYILTGVTSNEGQAIKGLTVSKNTEVSFNDFNKISGFKGDNGAFEIDGTLNLNISVDNFTTEITDNGSVGMINHGNLNISTTGSSIYKIDSNVSSKIDNINGAISISGSADDVVTEDITKASGVTFTSKVSNQNVTVNKGGRLNVGSLTSFENSNLTVNDGGHFNVGISNVKFDNVTFNDGSKLSMRIDNSNSYGTITATNNFTISDGSNFNLLIGKNAIEKGQSENFQLFIRESDLNYAVEDNFNLNFKNNMYVITQIGNGWYRVNYGLSGEQIAAENGGSKSTQLTARAWTDGEEIQANTNALASEIQTKLYETAQLDGKKYVEDLNSLMPSAAPIVQLTERQIATSMFNAASERGGNTAFATSNNMDVNINHNLSYWLDIGGSITDFKPSRFSDVDMSAYRISSGIDYHQNGGYFGVGYMYHVHDIDAYMRNIEAKSNTAMIYGGYDHDKFFVDAVFGYTNTKYDEHKSVYDKDISADYSADSLNASLKGGVKVKASEEVTIKPTVAVKNYNIKRHAYTDTLEQKVDNQDMTVVTTEIGADFLYKDKSVETNLGLYYGYDVKTDNESYNVDILNGSSYNAKAAKLGKHSGIVDVGINYKPSDNSKVGIGYEGNFRKDYINHSAKFELEVNF